MPVNECQLDGKSGYKWGDGGKCYTYNSDNEQSKKDAKQKALNQGIAMGDIDISKSFENGEDNFVYATVYAQNIWTKADGTKFTICEKCNEAHYISELNDGSCPSCSNRCLDAHNEGMDSNAIEKACWGYLKTINDKALMSYKALDAIQKVINGDEEIDVTDIVSYIAKNKYHVGFLHEIFEEDIGYPVENHCVREKVQAFGEEYDKYTWKAGFVLSDSIFEKVKDGTIVGFSFGASGFSSEIN